MAWYQPQNEIPPPKRGPSRLWLRGLIAGVLVVAGAIGVWFWFTPSSPSEETPVVSPKPKKVKTVRPTPVPRTAEPKREAIVPEKPKKLNFWEYPVSRTNELNAAQIRKWKGMNRAPAGITNNTSSVEAPPKYAIFKYRSENEIAALLTLRPGEGIVGTPTYGKWFEEDFLKACEEDVAILPEDTPEEAELKRAMNETKADIRKRVAEGEKVGDILLAARREHQELAMYSVR